MNQVIADSKIRNIIETIKLALKPLLESDEIIGNNKEDIKSIISQQDNKRIHELEEQTNKVHLLENEKNIVQKAKVSEKEAQIKADEVHKVKEGKTTIQEKIKE